MTPNGFTNISEVVREFGLPSAKLLNDRIRRWKEKAPHCQIRRLGELIHYGDLTALMNEAAANKSSRAVKMSRELSRVALRGRPNMRPRKSNAKFLEAVRANLSELERNP